MKGQDIPYLFMDETGTPWFYNMAGEIFNIENDKIRKIDISSPHPDLTIYYFLFMKIVFTLPGAALIHMFPINMIIAI